MMSDAGQGISPTGLLVVLWVLTGASTILFVGRLLIRSILRKTFHLDDAFSALAWFLLLVSMICATVENPLTYQFSSILIGETPAPPEDDVADMAITFAFMFLYRVVLRTGSRGKHRAVWVSALVYIILCYGICLIGVYGQCGDARNLFTYRRCMTPYVASLDSKLIWISYFFNVSSDLVVIILPLPLIWNLRMRLTQKLAMSSLCGLAIVTIAFETVRSVKLYQPSSALTYLYSYLELTISVLVCMLPSYRFLISPADKDREYRRLFWSRITMRSYHSGSSGYSMNSYPRSHTTESTRAINHIHEQHPPLPTADQNNRVDG
ncbi:hypothetical protein F4805DRAFT_468321 [Annulohypoxylon moriforme]|nr:hypothetical protein F4805DRAFT_468321 [Annulohypoxylon moriforme]